MDLSWTRDEWTDFLTRICHIDLDRATHIATQFVRQKFHMGQFQSVVSQCEMHPKMAKELLLGVGFCAMDIFPFIDALHQMATKMVAEDWLPTIRWPSFRTYKVIPLNRLPNDLVFEVCREIPLKRQKSVLLSSVKMRTYLEHSFRTVMYRALIDFLEMGLHDNRQIRILVEAALSNQRKRKVVHQSAHRFEFVTNQLHIRVWTYTSEHKSMQCHIYESAFGNTQKLLPQFVAMIAQLMQPTKLDLGDSQKPPEELHHLLDNTNRFEWIRLRAEHFFSGQMCSALANHDWLQIERTNTVDLVDWAHFCGALIAWLSSGQTKQKQCIFYLFSSDEQRLDLLLEAVRTDFSRATSTCSFAMRIHQWDCFYPPAHQLPSMPLNDAFAVRNGVGEVLELSGPKLSVNAATSSNYMLVRRPIGEPYDKDETCLELPNVGKISEIVLI